MLQLSTVFLLLFSVVDVTSVVVADDDDNGKDRIGVSSCCLASAKADSKAFSLELTSMTTAVVLFRRNAFTSKCLTRSLLLID